MSDTQGTLEGAPERLAPVPFLVRKVTRETRDTVTLDLVPPEVPSPGNGELRFLPGQFNMLYVYGVGEVPISISGDPGHPRALVHTVRGVGAVSRAICELGKGDTVGVRGPYGSHWPVEESAGEDVLIIAGGIGLAPLRPALYAILARREKFGKVVLLYGCRTPADMLYRKELEKWRGRFDLEVEITVDSAGVDWRGNVGVVTLLVRRAPIDPFSTVAMVCGPELMMRFAIQELQSFRISSERIYLSMERNMKCATGFCGHCQYGPEFICKDGPVFRFDRVQWLFGRREI
jgi:NAD(P)H-flavin reductase